MTTATIDRTQAPKVYPIGDIQIFEAKERTLSNGLPIYMLDSGVQPLLAAEFYFQIPHSPNAPATLPAFAFKMLMEGTFSKTGGVLADALSYYGAFTEVAVNADRGTLVVYSLKRHFERVMALVKEAIEESSIPIAEFEKLRNISRQSLEINQLKTSFQASQIFKQNLFGTQSRYGRISTLVEIDALTHLQVQNFYQQYIQHAAFEIILAGQVDQTEIDVLGKLFGSSSKTKVNQEQEVLNPSLERIELTHIMDESMQSTIRMGGLTISIHHPDYPALKVANEVLGGYFGSRLMKNIREEKGYTYGIYSQVASNKNYAQFLVASDVKKEKTGEAIAEIKNEMRKLMVEPIDADELYTVKNYMLGTLLNSLNTPFALADKFKSVHFNGIGYGYFNHYIETVRNISAEQILETCTTYFKPDNMLEVVAGERQAL